MYADTTIVQLLHGLVVDGTRHRQAVLHPLTGRHEALLNGLDAPARATSHLIAAMVVRIGDISPITVERAAALTVGDRERLMLATAMLLLGDAVDLMAKCPSSECSALLDVPLRLQDLLDLDTAVLPLTTQCVEVAGPGGNWVFVARPPTGADQESVMHLTTGAASALVAACVQDATDAAGLNVAPGQIPSEFSSAISEALLAFDPTAEALSQTVCPECGAEMDVLLDALSLLKTSLAGSLDRDVYRMARNYHWSEADILALPVKRRKQYLDIAANMESLS